MTYTFVIPGEPVAQKRARVGVMMIGGKPRARVYDHKSVSAKTGWKGEVMSFLASELQRAQMPMPLFADVPLFVELTFVFSCPKSQYRIRTPTPMRWHSKKPDIDNLWKAVLDAASGVLWQDDRQIVAGKTAKVIAAQGDGGMTIVTVREAGKRVSVEVPV